jgi:hypothetical protein
MKIANLVRLLLVLLSVCTLVVGLAAQTTEEARLTLSVAVRPGPPVESDYSNARNCTPEKTGSIDCTAFHYTVRNVGTSPIMLVWSTCNGFFIGVHDFRVNSGEWHTLRDTPFMCARNMTIRVVMAPGSTREGEFTITGLPYDTSPLRSRGEYQLRFTFFPVVCDPETDSRKPPKSCRLLQRTITDEVEVHLR